MTLVCVLLGICAVELLLILVMVCMTADEVLAGFKDLRNVYYDAQGIVKQRYRDSAPGSPPTAAEMANWRLSAAKKYKYLAPTPST